MAGEEPLAARARRVPGPGATARWRAVIGAALLTLAAGGVVFSHRAAQQPPSQRYVITVGEIATGESITAEDLGTVALDLPDAVDAIPAEEVDQVIGRVAGHSVGPSGLVRESDLLAPGTFEHRDEIQVAVSLDPARVPLGAFAHGDVVHLLRTTADGVTATLTTDARVTRIGDGEGGDPDDSGIGGGSPVRVHMTVPDIGQASEVISASVTEELTIVLPAPTPTGAP